MSDFPELTTAEYEALRVMPMERFDSEHRAHINELAAGPNPPPKWLYCAFPGETRPMFSVRSRAWFEWHLRRSGDPRRRREKIPRRLREQVLRRDGMICQICLCPIGSRRHVHVDHIEPLVHGGATVLGNLRVTHAACNLRKGAKR